MTCFQRKLLSIHLKGYALIFLKLAIFSLISLWVIQIAALSFGETYDWQNILRQIFLSLCFVAFYPGQTLWTFRVTADNGDVHTIVGLHDPDARPTRDHE
ncbi:MAG: hypothetical protein AB8B71_12800 [Paracoccaceae bacterium]